MKNYLFLGIFILLLTACQKENINPIPQDASENTTIKERRTGGIKLPNITTGPTHVDSDVSAMNTCSGLHVSSLPAITNTSAWSVGNFTTAGYIDYELDQAFKCSPYFSMCAIRPGGPLVHTHVVEFLLGDNGYLGFDPVLGLVPMYNFLSSSIDAPTAEVLKQHFACEIKAYKDAHCPNYFINNVDFSGDALLCTCPSGQTHYLRATVTFQLY